METRELIMTILSVSLQLIVGIVLFYSIEFLKKKISIATLQNCYTLIEYFVKGVEQIFGAGNGDKKKEVVLEIAQKIMGNVLTTEEIDKLIESAVYEMNLVLKKEGLKK